MQQGEAWLRAQGRWPPEPDAAYRQLAELRAKQSQGRRQMVGIGGPLAQPPQPTYQPPPQGPADFRPQ
jgi:hypothetical protein